MAPLGTSGRAAVVPRVKAVPGHPLRTWRSCHRLPRPGPVPPSSAPAVLLHRPAIMQSRNQPVLCRASGPFQRRSLASPSPKPLSTHSLPLDHHRKPVLWDPEPLLCTVEISTV